MCPFVQAYLRHAITHATSGCNVRPLLFFHGHTPRSNAKSLVVMYASLLVGLPLIVDPGPIHSSMDCGYSAIRWLLCPCV